MGKPVVGEVVVRPFPQTNLQVGLENTVHNCALMSPFGFNSSIIVEGVKVGATAAAIWDCYCTQSVNVSK